MVQAQQAAPTTSRTHHRVPMVAVHEEGAGGHPGGCAPEGCQAPHALPAVCTGKRHHRDAILKIFCTHMVDHGRCKKGAWWCESSSRQRLHTCSWIRPWPAKSHSLCGDAARVLGGQILHLRGKVLLSGLPVGDDGRAGLYGVSIRQGQLLGMAARSNRHVTLNTRLQPSTCSKHARSMGGSMKALKPTCLPQPGPPALCLQGGSVRRRSTAVAGTPHAGGKWTGSRA